MKRLSISCMTVWLSLIAALCLPLSLWAQGPEPAPEHQILQRDVGTWEATLQFWIGADGKADPTAEPQTSTGTEVNRMLGPFWLLSEFKGEFGGLPFEGHSINGFDPQTKKFTGTWIDSMTPNPMRMSGTFDAKTQTLTSTSRGIGMDGQPATGKVVVVYDGDQSRRMTMFENIDGKEVKSMEIIYKRKP